MPRGDSRSEKEAGRHWIVSGRVQGVGFRHHVRTEARRLGLVGDVRNLSDGRVEIRARGPREAIERLLASVRRGPRWARVDAIEDGALSTKDAFVDFTIR